jgi:cytochrome c
MNVWVLSVIGLLATTGAAWADGDPAAGAQVFKRCAACHAVGDGAVNRIGPVLNGVVGRTAGTFDSYKYSSAMLAAGQGGLVWTPDALTQYLHKPRDMVPGTKMTFPGLPNDQDIANVVAYLLTLSPDYVPEAPAATAPAPAAPAPAAPAQ